jgi:hypothetical protein
MVGPHKAIIIANPQHRRQSLAALLRSMPEIGEIYECDNTHSLESQLYFYPSLILIDCWLDEKITPELIEPLRRLFPGAHILALVKQNEFAANNPGVDSSLVEGFKVEQFFQTVRSLVNSLHVLL